MTNSCFDQSEALDLIYSLACHLASELDLHYENLPADVFRSEFEALVKAKASLVADGRQVPAVVDHVLAIRSKKLN
tara:strand:- start:76 stop:303 length:228 start_codon:yes stop_codon:yes gene_type:complete